MDAAKAAGQIRQAAAAFVLDSVSPEYGDLSQVSNALIEALALVVTAEYRKDGQLQPVPAKSAAFITAFREWQFTHPWEQPS